MFLEIKRSFGKKRRKKSMSVYWVQYLNGQRKRRYLRQSNYEGLKHLLDSRSAGGPGCFFSPGRPVAIPAEIRTMLEDCGFSIYGTRICMHRSRFFSPEAAYFRYDLLREQQKAAVMYSPGNMLELEKQAYSRLKSCNAQGLSLDYAKCLNKVHQWFYESIKRLGLSEEADRQAHAGSTPRM